MNIFARKTNGSQKIRVEYFFHANQTQVSRLEKAWSANTMDNDTPEFTL